MSKIRYIDTATISGQISPNCLNRCRILTLSREVVTLQWSASTKGYTKQGLNQMQAYSEAFARVYNARWSAFARRIAPIIYEYCEGTGICLNDKPILDLCCGTGQLAAYFLQHNCSIVGIDLSPHMLKYANENVREYVLSGRARLVQGDASNFTVDEKCSLAVSTFDSLNHLVDEVALERCFRCVHSVCDGPFIFDFNTPKGVRASTMMQVDDSSDELLLVLQGVYDTGGQRACLRFFGCAGMDGTHLRFDETVYSQAFKLETVMELLASAGWGHSHFAHINNLRTVLSIDEAGDQSRIFVVATNKGK